MYSLTQEKELFQLKVLPMSYIMVCVHAFVCVRACMVRWRVGRVLCMLCLTAVSIRGGCTGGASGDREDSAHPRQRQKEIQ